MRNNNQKKNIFCLEGSWDANFKSKSTIEPVLDLLDKCQITKYIHKDCATKSEMEFYLKKWTNKQYDDYPILYLAFHGEQNTLHLQDSKITLEEIAEILANRCKGRILIFGSCSTLNIDKRYIKKLLKTTAALAVCGYGTDVDWVKSTANDLLIIEALQGNEFSLRGIDSIVIKINDIAKKFKELEFRMITQKELK
ncbi:DUF6642 family protein [Roseivirga sp.]|uniref:DUF6642 family protein n=1 Tax=Roseivirga sp. TaxID=1964215 RepID=UPI002B27B080|nr:DUF6642 family protein [Roseivirga sp.]